MSILRLGRRALRQTQRGKDSHDRYANIEINYLLQRMEAYRSLAILATKRLSRFNLAGGSIHNVALNAAFMAAQADTSVTMPLIIESVRSEFRKLEKPINEADFRMIKPVGVKT